MSFKFKSLVLFIKIVTKLLLLRRFDYLRTVPTVVTAHTVCASGDVLGFPVGGAYYYRDIFVGFKTMRRKQNLASDFGIQKENWG